MKFNHPYMLTLLSLFPIRKKKKKGEILNHLLLNIYDLVSKISSEKSKIWHWRVEIQGECCLLRLKYLTLVVPHLSSCRRSKLACYLWWIFALEEDFSTWSWIAFKKNPKQTTTKNSSTKLDQCEALYLTDVNIVSFNFYVT